MPYTKKALLAHPGFNPAHRHDLRERYARDPQTGRITVVAYGPRNSSRWLPHGGKQEAARRLGQMKARAYV